MTLFFFNSTIRIIFIENFDFSSKVYVLETNSAIGFEGILYRDQAA